MALHPMTDPAYIEKVQPDPAGLDFFGLKQEGIELLQELSGKAWTDYNLHDPGITILEVLCYGLTDLAYRTEFEVADFLTGKNGSIDYETLALFRPQDILPSQAVTLNDYRKLIFDSVAEIENVWLTPARPSPTAPQGLDYHGLYCISVMPSGMASQPDQNDQDAPRHRRIEEKIRRLFAGHRNLGEDLMQVRIVKPDYYSLHGTIEIGGIRNPDDILAEIYFKSSKYLCPALAFRPYDAMIRQGHSLADIFTGPLTEHGYISAEDLDADREFAHASELIGIISEIEGVKFVDSLWFEDGLDFIEYDRTLQSMPCLRLPVIKDEIEMTLAKNGRTHPVALNNVRVEFERLNFEDRALRRIRQDIAGVCDLPRGNYRDFSEYFSIQHHFPELYGIGSQGVSERSRHLGPLAQRKGDYARRRAQSRQLKAYLLLFEQNLANFLANLQSLSRLFSVDHRLDRSYFHQLLDDKVVPAVDEIYREDFAQTDAGIGRLLRKYDNFRDRRNRILDYLLGIYGERFSQSSLRRFKSYHSAKHEFEHEMILNKITFLKELRDLSRRRAGAFNYLEPSWDNPDNIACLKKKVRILLGLQNMPDRDEKSPEGEDFHVVEHILLRPLNKMSHDTQVPNHFYSFKISVLFPAWTGRFENPQFRKLAEETVELNCPAHVLPVFYWLDEKQMNTFEVVYRDWLEQKCESGSSAVQLDLYSHRLIEFLIDQQE